MAQFLVVGPHPDDQELGMGGSIAKFVSKGDIIFYSKQWQEFGRQNIEPNHLWVAKGSQDIQINASVPGEVADIYVEFRTAGEPIRLNFN